jgi:hypothetical protein
VTAASGWDQTLRPWRRASGLIAVVEVPAVVATFALVFLGRGSTRSWALLAAAAVVLLDVAQWALARAALRRVPDSFPAESYASLPLDRRSRQLVWFAMLAGLTTPILLLAVMPKSSSFHDHLGVAAVLLIASETPSVLSLYRVWRHQSWLAISRIPARARRSHPQYTGPRAT